MATDEELKELLGEDTGAAPPAEEAPKEPKEPAEATPEEDPEVKAKREQLANLGKAIDDEKDRLRVARKARKDAEKPSGKEEEEVPEIDLKNPGAKAWDNRIKEAVAPATAELEKAKEERRLFALCQFLEDKPALAKDPAKLKAMMTTYDRLKTSSELTNEGITMDLEKAYAAEHSTELMRAARNARVDGAQREAIFSDPAVSRGSSTYSKEDEVQPERLTEEQRQILSKWGMTPAEWQAEKKKYG